MSLFSIYENTANLYKGNAKDIEELYHECKRTCTNSWKPIKDFVAKREPEPGRVRITKTTTREEWYKVHNKKYTEKWFQDKDENGNPILDENGNPTGVRMEKNYDPNELVEMTYELKPDRNYDNILVSKLIVAFKDYITAMMNKFRNSMTADQVMFEAEDTLIFALDWYIPERTTYNKRTGTYTKSSFKQTFNRFFTNHLAGYCQHTSKLKRTGREKQYTKDVDPEVQRKEDPQVIVNSLEFMLDNGGFGLPSSENVFQNVEESLNLTCNIKILLNRIEDTRQRNTAEKLINKILNGQKVNKNTLAINQLKTLIKDNKSLFFREDLIS